MSEEIDKTRTDVNRQVALIVTGLNTITVQYAEHMRELIMDYRDRIKYELPDALKDIMERDYDILEKTLDKLLDGIDEALDRDLGRILYLVDKESYEDSAFAFSERDPEEPSPHEKPEQPAESVKEAAK